MRECDALEVLRIDGCTRLTDYACLRRLTRLTSLWVGPTDKFGDRELARIAKHGRLQGVLMSGCRISDAGEASAHGLCTTCAGLRFLASHCRNVQEVSACNVPITDDGTDACVHTHKRVQVLNVCSPIVPNCVC